MRWKRVAAGAIGVAGVAALGMAWLYRRQQTNGAPEYAVETQGGPVELRLYAPLTVAETVQKGTRERATTSGFGLLADYIFAESREGEAIPLLMPLLVSEAGAGAWRVRLPMPHGATPESLPEPGPGVRIATLPERRVATLRFPGRVTGAVLARKAAELHDWIVERGLAAIEPAEHAYYSAPSMPGPLRHNEIMIAVG
ncbi:MAG TPA: heme-binding protein [Sphingomonadaceae bacterium]|nr:heme-binding protein [Sphingomonadaceae bacterium]